MMKGVRLGVLATCLAVTPALADPPDCKGFTPPKAANSHIVQEYPVLSAILHEEGTTILAFVINEDGTVGSVSVARSSGSLRLDDAAVDAVSHQWRYAPAMTPDGKPVACRWKAAVKWVLQASSPMILQRAPGAVVMKLEDYPPDARSRGEEGYVGLLVLAIPSGSQKVAIVLRSSGFSELDATAVKIVTDRLQMPIAELDGKPVPTSAIVTIIWSLHPDAAPSGGPESAAQKPESGAIKPK
jgi:TonB family protein